MSRLIKCPQSEQLLLLIGDNNAIAMSDDLLKHVSECGVCSAVLVELIERDPLAKRLVHVGWPPSRASLEDQSLSLQIADAVETQLNGLDNTIGISPRRLDSTLDLSWLEPSEGPDELGRLGKFRVIRLLGRGGMGAVFEAEDSRLQRRVALKVILPGLSVDRSIADRFLHEARSAAAVHNPHVVTIFEVGQSGSIPYLAMELLKGESLEDRLAKDGRIDPLEASAIAAQVAVGLAAAHRQGVLHRDIKPANIWIEFDEHSSEQIPKVKLLDFGLAKSMIEQNMMTQSGLLIGTLQYLSPEQARGEKLDARSDLFSLGCVLYRMLSGQLPFRGKDAMSQLYALANTKPARLDTLVPHLPENLVQLTHRLLAEDVASRPSNASDLAADLNSIDLEQGTVTASLPSTVKSSPVATFNGGNRWGFRNGSRWLLAGLFPVTILLGVILLTFKDKDGKETKIKIEVPDGTSLLSVDESKSPSADLNATELKDRPSVSDDMNRRDKATDLRDPNVVDIRFQADGIDSAERLKWMPQELVAVIGQHRDRHWSGVSQVRFHPSGDFFLTIPSTGDTACLRDSKLLTKFDGALDEKLARWAFSNMGEEFSTDGQLLASANQVFKVGHSDPHHPTITLDQTLPTNDNQFGYYDVAIHDNRWLIVGANEPGGLMVWDVTVKPAKLVKKIPSGILVQSMSLSKDGQKLVVCSEGIVYLWDVDWRDVSDPVFNMRQEKISAGHAALSADGLTLVTGGEGYPTTEIRDLSVSPALLQQTIEGGRIFSFSKDDKRLAIAAGIGIQLYEYIDNTWVRRIVMADGMSVVTSLAWSPTEDQLVAGDLHGGIHVWNTSVNPPKKQNPSIPVSSVLDMVIAPDGKTAILQAADGSITRWNLEGDTPIQDSSPAKLSSASLPQFSFDSKLLVLDNAVWNLGTKQPEKISENIANFAKMSPIDRRILTTSENHLLEYEWSITKRGNFQKSNEKVIWTKPGNPFPAPEATWAFDWDSNRFAIAQDESALSVWNMLAANKPILEVQHKFQSVKNLLQLSFAKGGNLLLGVTDSESVVWDLEENPPQEYRLSLEPNFQHAVFAQNDKYLLVADGGGVGIYDWSKNREYRRLPYPGLVRKIVMHPDGKHFATVNGNGTVYFLNIPL